jgi:diguanylate cyclase (GGDEF)-like protein/PAS domain S-box-containing protein
MAPADIQQDGELYQALVESSAELIAMLDAGGHVRFVNQAVEEILGYSAAEMVGRHYSSFLDPRDLRLASDVGAEIGSGRSRISKEVSARRKDGDLVHLHLNARRVSGPDGEIGGIVATASDVTEQRRLLEELEALANEDDLTGLPNRRYFLTELDRYLERADLARDRGALLMLDVDGLKHVNDVHGHAAGDQFIVEMATRLASALGEGELLARLRGDEFAVLMPGAGPARVVQTAEAMLRAIAADEFPVGPGINATASVGGQLLRHETTVDAALRDADHALYEAKRRGGARAVLT